MELIELGWNKILEKEFNDTFEKNYVPARIIESNVLIYTLLSEKGEFSGKLSGKFRHSCSSKGDFPTVGDWIIYKPQLQKGFVSIIGMLDRGHSFSRKVAGRESDAQVIAANIDTIFIVNGLDQDFNIRRIERYVTLAAESGANYAIILNKADLCEKLNEIKGKVTEAFPNIPVISLSAKKNKGLEQLDPFLQKGKTIVFLGSSGVGKSSIVNCLLGENKIKTGKVSDYDGRGRHTTTSKNLIVLPQGGLVIDTPGLREIQMLGTGEGLSAAFSEINDLAPYCKYKDCSHRSEPGCAVLKAVENGELLQERLDNYHKLQKEISYNASRSQKKYADEKNKFFKKIAKDAKMIRKLKLEGR